VRPHRSQDIEINETIYDLFELIEDEHEQETAASK
jgi:hypothetical protein